MTHQTEVHEFASLHTLTETELDSISGGADAYKECAAATSLLAAVYTWYNLLGQYNVPA